MTFHKHYFNILRGFDESFDVYGMDEIDFIARMEQKRIKKYLFLHMKGRKLYSIVGRMLTGISPEVNREFFVLPAMAYSDCHNG